MYKIISSLILFSILIPNLYADSYIATRQELWFSDSSYYKTSHHIKVGKSIMLKDYKIFGEVGLGEDINEGTPVGSGASFDYLRFGISKVFFDSWLILSLSSPSGRSFILKKQGIKTTGTRIIVRATRQIVTKLSTQSRY